MHMLAKGTQAGSEGEPDTGKHQVSTLTLQHLSEDTLFQVMVSFS